MKLSCVFMAAMALVSAHGPSSHPDWLSFKEGHGKSYESLSEEQARLKLFMANKAKVERHNQEFAEGKHTHWKQMDFMADMTDREMERMKGYRPRSPEEQAELDKTNPPLQLAAPAYGLPSYVDWRESGIVGPIQNQGQCGSCWTFAASAALEGRIALRNRQFTKLSEQNLLDCTSPSDNCELGGRADDAFSYIQRNDGVDTEIAYPYQGWKAQCRYDPRTRGGYSNGYQRATGEDGLQQAVAQGPVAVAVASNSMQGYAGGVHHCPAGDKVDHAVSVVGYGTDARYGDYWLVRNSWGPQFGENGYIKVARNSCGIASDVTYPIV